MIRIVLGAVLVVTTWGATTIGAQPNAERSNAALDQLRAGGWAGRGGFDSSEPVAGVVLGLEAVQATHREGRFTHVSWDTPPSLTPTLTPDGPIRAPVPVEVRPVTPAQPVRTAPIGRFTPCQDLRAKAQRLRNAATQCDTDVINGAPYCRVEVTFDSPRIARSLSASEARGHAGRFESVAGAGSEYACADFGGEGYVPGPAGPSIMERIKDAVDSVANEQVRAALLEYAVGGLLSKIMYGPDATWTHALKNHSHLNMVRQLIRDEYRRSPADRVSSGNVPYRLNKVSFTENIRLLLRDLAAPILGANMAYATGSINFHWEQEGAVDYGRREVTVRITAKDELRVGSLTRIPTTDIELLPDDPFGQNGPMHTVKLEWQWTEVIRY